MVVHNIKQTKWQVVWCARIDGITNEKTVKCKRMMRFVKWQQSILSRVVSGLCAISNKKLGLLYFGCILYCNTRRTNYVHMPHLTCLLITTIKWNYLMPWLICRRGGQNILHIYSVCISLYIYIYNSNVVLKHPAAKKIVDTN